MNPYPLFGMFRPDLSRGNMNIIAQYYYAVLFYNNIDRQGQHQYYYTIVLCKNIVRLGAALMKYFAVLF